jgi:hypothetical protein
VSYKRWLALTPPGDPSRPARERLVAQTERRISGAR